MERERRTDARFAVLATILANANRDQEKCPEPFQPGDFFSSLAHDREADPEETLEEFEARLDALATVDLTKPAK